MDMSIRGLSEQLNAEMAYLKVYLQVEKETGFTNAAKVIELLSIQLFRAAGIANFTDANLVKMNFPAIDLHELKAGNKGIAAQVTSSATATKIKNTIVQYEKDRKGKKLTDDYEKLYILGLLKVTKNLKNLPHYCEILSFNDLIQKIISKNDVNAMYDAIDAIRANLQRPMLLRPSQDIPALMIVLGIMNRSAIKHYMDREGSVSDMVKGLKDVTEVIYKGSIQGKSISKMHYEYASNDIRDFLNRVGNVVDSITGIVNGASNGFYLLDINQKRDIDLMKAAIVQEVNAISARFKLNFTMAMI